MQADSVVKLPKHRLSSKVHVSLIREATLGGSGRGTGESQAASCPETLLFGDTLPTPSPGERNSQNSDKPAVRTATAEIAGSGRGPYLQNG